MTNDQDKLAQLMANMEILLKKQQHFLVEINELRKEIQILRNTQAVKLKSQTSDIPEQPIVDFEKKEPRALKNDIETGISYTLQETPVIKQESNKADVGKQINKPSGKSNLEKFIGENLINKIGILITIIGVVIGAKYSIENNLISPLTRIVLGYLVGLGLLGFGFKLKAKYENYSAVLVSGALAILYFITFAAFDFYGLFSQTLAFTIMLLFTVFGVIAALNYNKQIIAHIGLVGAYAIPFLLSNNTGNATVLFTYIAIINIGILTLSFKKYWKPLYYVSFAFTWLIIISWSLFSYNQETDFSMAFGFICLFFLIFYSTALSYKLIKSEKFNASDIVLLLLNSFIFYGLGYYFIADLENGEQLLGLYTLANALVHFIVSVLIYKKKLADKNLFFLASGLVLTFVTIAVPVQLDGNWVTLLWAFEAALLFWIGRTKNIPTYEKLAYPLIGLAFFSLLHNWGNTYDHYYYTEEPLLKPFLNSTMLTSLLCLISFGFINWIQNRYKENSKSFFSKIKSIGIPALFLVTLYFSFYLEIGYYWNVLLQESMIENKEVLDHTYMEYNYALEDFSIIWLLNYTLLFMGLLAIFNLSRIKSKTLGILTLTVSVIAAIAFLTIGLFTISELRDTYLFTDESDLYIRNSQYIWIRYIAFLFFGFLLWCIYKLVRAPFLKINFKITSEILLHTSILWIASSELLHWMDIAGSQQSYKLGLSILWGMYALLLIVLGIWKKKKYLRIGAIILFSLTLLKLFLYDISSLNTIAKTIVFVSLGALLLIISFLYNKYKHVITDEP